MNELVINFIKQGIIDKTMSIVDLNFSIYRIQTKSGKYFVYTINGCDNYLDSRKQPVTASIRQFIIDKLIDGTFVKEKIWGDN